MTPVRLLKNFSDLYAYSFWKLFYPVRFIREIKVNLQKINSNDNLWIKPALNEVVWTCRTTVSLFLRKEMLEKIEKIEKVR